MIRQCLVLIVATFALVAASCATNATDPVQALVRERTAQDGNTVRIRGVLRSSHGLFNLYARNSHVCIGLLMRSDDLNRYRALEGKTVSVSGTLHAEGCGRDGICDEHLCGPAVLRNVTITIER